MYRLDIGSGPHSDYEVQIDQVKWPKVTHVLDVATDDLPFERDTFDEVRCSQVLEHIPVVIYWKENGKFNKRYSRVKVFSEVFRVLKPGGLFRISVPVDWPYWAQDPTHVDVPVLADTLEYFCGGWGAGKPGDFASDAYGIDFAFKWVQRQQVGFNLDAILQKP